MLKKVYMFVLIVPASHLKDAKKNLLLFLQILLGGIYLKTCLFCLEIAWRTKQTERNTKPNFHIKNTFTFFHFFNFIFGFDRCLAPYFALRPKNKKKTMELDLFFSIFFGL